MKDYKRLTERITASNTGRTVLVIPTFRHEIIEQTKRLAELEDKIESGELGDVKELKQELKAQELAANAYRIWFAEQKYWREVAERALDLCETAYILSLNHRATEGISGQAIASDLGVHKFFIRQAEKELEEEKSKDDSPRT